MTKPIPWCNCKVSRHDLFESHTRNCNIAKWVRINKKKYGTKFTGGMELLMEHAKNNNWL